MTLSEKKWIDAVKQSRIYDALDEPAEAFWSIIEQLYQSENAIDEEIIDAAFIRLCEHFDINLDHMLHGLQVRHVKDTSKRDL